MRDKHVLLTSKSDSCLTRVSYSITRLDCTINFINFDVGGAFHAFQGMFVEFEFWAFGRPTPWISVKSVDCRMLADVSDFPLVLVVVEFVQYLLAVVMPCGLRHFNF